jgi:hypothetical protein
MKIDKNDTFENKKYELFNLILARVSPPPPPTPQLSENKIIIECLEYSIRRARRN